MQKVEISILFIRSTFSKKYYKIRNFTYKISWHAVVQKTNVWNLIVQTQNSYYKINVWNAIVQNHKLITIWNAKVQNQELIYKINV